MDPKGKHPSIGDLFKQPLAELINIKHPLVKLAELIDWSVFETRWAEYFPSRTRRPASSPRLIAGFLYLQHTFACSDEDLIWTWVETRTGSTSVVKPTSSTSHRLTPRR